MWQFADTHLSRLDEFTTLGFIRSMQIIEIICWQCISTTFSLSVQFDDDRLIRVGIGEYLGGVHVHVHVYVYVHVCVYVRVHVHVHVCMCMNMCMSMCMSMNMSICMSMSMSTCTYTSMDVQLIGRCQLHLAHAMCLPLDDLALDEID